MDPCDSDDVARLTDSYVAKVRTMNDTFRKSFIGGRLMVTAGVSALGEAHVAALLELVRNFDDFGPDNDPHGEHDFGRIDHGGYRHFFKIDYYDREMRYGSEDPTEPEQTMRVLTIMLASEW